MKTIKGNFEFGGVLFQGLKFNRTKKYSEKFFDELTEEGSHYSKIKYRDAVKELQLEGIHIKLSYSHIARVLSIFTLIIAVIVGIKYKIQIPTLSILPALCIIGFSFIAHLFFQFFKRKANELFMGLELSKNLVDLLFNKKNK